MFELSRVDVKHLSLTRVLSMISALSLSDLHHVSLSRYKKHKTFSPSDGFHLSDSPVMSDHCKAM